MFHIHKWELLKKGWYGGVLNAGHFFGTLYACHRCGEIKEELAITNYKVAGWSREEIANQFTENDNSVN